MARSENYTEKTARVSVCRWPPVCSLLLLRSFEDFWLWFLGLYCARSSFHIRQHKLVLLDRGYCYLLIRVYCEVQQETGRQLGAVFSSYQVNSIIPSLPGNSLRNSSPQKYSLKYLYQTKDFSSVENKSRLFQKDWVAVHFNNNIWRKVNPFNYPFKTSSGCL